MGKTKRKAETIYIDPEKAELLVALSQSTRIPRAVLWREALDGLLMKHGVLKPKRRTS